jgi:MoxR-like ATPase
MFNGTEDIRKKVEALQENLSKVIKGKEEVIKLSIVTLVARGHLLIEDIPGVGKTTLAHSLAQSINCSFQRIQFTSDLLPSDIIGITVYNQAKNLFEFKEGPVFANIILADEINRTTPKSQSALLEAMNDHQVSVERTTYPLPEPFLVLATQNPLEYEGTYPLPESQLDRFMMCLRIGYSGREHEKQILTSSREDLLPESLRSVIGGDDILFLQSQVEKIKVDDSLVEYILDIVDATRNNRDTIELGVSTRGAIALYRASQALALIEGRDFVIPDDIKRLVHRVLSHRVILKPGIDGGSLEGREEIIKEVIKRVGVPL